MSPIFKYMCPCGKEFTELVKSFDDVVNCECGKPSDKQVSAPILGNMNKFGSSK